MLLDRGASVDKPNMVTERRLGFDCEILMIVNCEFSGARNCKVSLNVLLLYSTGLTITIISLRITRISNLVRYFAFIQEHGFSALVVASQCGHTEVAGVLLARGATADNQNKVRHFVVFNNMETS